MNIIPNIKLFVCPICQRRCASQAGLKIHKKIHSDELCTDQKIRTENLGPLIPRLPCGACKAVMRSPEARAEHRRRFHAPRFGEVRA